LPQAGVRLTIGWQITNPMQRVFSLALRRQNAEGRRAAGRNGELKTDWTEPQGDLRSYGFWIATRSLMAAKQRDWKVLFAARTQF